MADASTMQDVRKRIDGLVEVVLNGHLVLLGAGFNLPKRTDWLADPEVVAVLIDERTPPRAVQEFGTWLAANSRLLSASRLRAWSGVLPTPRIEVEDVIASARRAARDRLLAPVDLGLPALRRIKLRALLGNGSRAEVVLVLATGPASTRRLARLTGFTEQALRAELRALATAGWIDRAGSYPEAYYISSELDQLVGPTAARIDIPWLHVIATLRRLESILDLLARDTRGAVLEALAQLTACAFMDRGSDVSWGQRKIPTPVTTEIFEEAISIICGELEDLISMEAPS